jgi:hypothetical protein
MQARHLQSPHAKPPGRQTSRRGFFKRALLGASGLALAGLAYSAIEAGWITIERRRIVVPRLPAAWNGTTLAQLTDLHHGPYTGLAYIERIVELTNSLRPELICITGDLVHTDPRYVAPCIQALSSLQASLGVFTVPGNHDYYEGIDRWHTALAETSIHNLTNTGIWLEKQGQGIRLAGVDDLWNGRPDLGSALGTMSRAETSLLLCHNPDFVETHLRDVRVGLVLSGHTHGGQVVLPLVGAPLVPSRFGQKYLHGLVQGPVAQVYVSRGLGTVTPPLRFCAPPELTLIELACEGQPAEQSERGSARVTGRSGSRKQT